MTAATLPGRRVMLAKGNIAAVTVMHKGTLRTAPFSLVAPVVVAFAARWPLGRVFDQAEKETQRLHYDTSALSRRSFSEQFSSCHSAALCCDYGEALLITEFRLSQVVQGE